MTKSKLKKDCNEIVSLVRFLNIFLQFCKELLQICSFLCVFFMQLPWRVFQSFSCKVSLQNCNLLGVLSCHVIAVLQSIAVDSQFPWCVFLPCYCSFAKYRCRFVFSLVCFLDVSLVCVLAICLQFCKVSLQICRLPGAFPSKVRDSGTDLKLLMSTDCRCRMDVCRSLLFPLVVLSFSSSPP